MISFCSTCVRARRLTSVHSPLCGGPHTSWLILKLEDKKAAQLCGSTGFPLSTLLQPVDTPGDAHSTPQRVFLRHILYIPQSSPSAKTCKAPDPRSWSCTEKYCGRPSSSHYGIILKESPGTVTRRAARVSAQPDIGVSLYSCYQVDRIAAQRTKRVRYWETRAWPGGHRADDLRRIRLSQSDERTGVCHRPTQVALLKYADRIIAMIMFAVSKGSTESKIR